MRKMLVLPDFSENATTAFLYALPLAAYFQADLVVAHVIKKPVMPASMPDL